jgi:hypothetical protein
VVGRAVTVGSLSSIKFLLSKIDLNSISEWKTLARFGRGGTASAVGEGLLQMKKSEENERFVGVLSSGFQPLTRLGLR